jgi:hypothetical protein
VIIVVNKSVKKRLSAPPIFLILFEDLTEEESVHACVDTRLFATCHLI